MHTLTYDLSSVPQLVVIAGNTGLSYDRAVDTEVIFSSHCCRIVTILELGGEQQGLHVINLVREWGGEGGRDKEKQKK